MRLAAQRRVQILQDIVNVFDAHGEPDTALGDPHSTSFRCGERAVRGDRWVAYLGEHIAQRRGWQAQLQIVHKAECCFARLLLQFEREQPSIAIIQQPVCEFVLGMGGEAGIIDSVNLRMLLQELRHL